MSSILVENGMVVTLDGRRSVISDGGVAIEDGKIVAVGKTENVKRDFKGEIRISAKKKLVIPGLIQTHLHPAQALIRGCADDLNLLEWLRMRVWPLQGNYNQRDGLVSTQLALIEMIKSGTTTFVGVDIHTRYGFEEIARAIEQAGSRAVLAKAVMDVAGYGRESAIMHPGMVEEKAASIREVRGLIRRWNRKGSRVKVWFAPRSLGGCTKGLYQEVAELAQECKTGITMHLNEVREDGEYTRRNYGVKPVEFMKEVGILGRHVIFAHMVWGDDREIRLLAKSKSNVAHCPTSNLKLASGLPRIHEMLEAGVNVGLGCDGAPCNNTLDLIREMRLAAILQKGRLLDPEAMPAERVVEMATINGARALGLEREIGSLEVGKKADLAIIDANKPHMTPSYDPVATLVYSANGGDVETVIADGRIIMEGRTLSTIDEERVLNEAERRASEVVERAGVKVPARWSIE